MYIKEHGVEFGLVIHPRTLLNYFVVFTGTEFDDREKERIAEIILRYTVDYTNEIDLRSFARLFASKIDGLTKEDTKIIEELFVKSPLRHELEQALEANRGDLAEDIAIKIITDESIVESIIQAREKDKRIKELARKLRKVYQELERERAARQALEKVAKSLEININITTEIDISTRHQLEGIIKILEGEDLFNREVIERLDLSTKEKVVQWLKKLEEIIKSSREISDTVKSLLPLVSTLLSKLT